MFVCRLVTSKLLIWLAAVAMPFQTAWATNCSCQPADRTLAATQPTSESSCCETPVATTSCCHAASTSCCQTSGPPLTCCDDEADAKRKAGCQCGADCSCVDRHDTVAGAFVVMALVCLGSGTDMLYCAFLFTAPILIAGVLYLACCWRKHDTTAAA